MFHGKIYLHRHCKIQQTLVRGKRVVANTPSDLVVTLGQ